MRTFLNLIVIGCTLSMPADLVPGQEQAHPDHAAMEAMWTAFATPGEPHAHFKDMVGSWSVESKDYMMNPNAPTTATGEAKFETVLGGRYLVQHYHSMMGGQPFEGMGITGYDNAKKKYVGSWVDNMGTGILNTEGTYDPATKSMTEYGEMSSPMGTIKMKMVSKHEQDDKFVFTMYMTMPDSTETKSMELTYTRK